jgi:hypothetical protein
MPTPFDSSRARGVIISTSLMHVVSLSLYFMFCKMYIHHAPKKRSNVARAAIGSLTAAIVGAIKPASHSRLTH